MIRKLNIDVICNDGSPLNTCLADVYGENGRIGLGGAELALHTLCEAWSKVGHRVRLYNSPPTNCTSPYSQFNIDAFSPHDERNILIIFRSPNERIRDAKGLKIWFSTDQYTIGDFKEFSHKVDKIVTISPFHDKHFQTVYEIRDTHIIDLPVRTWDYEQEVEKVPNRLIFCSVPDRGLNILADCYLVIKAEVPDASLVITSDYRLWGVESARNEQYLPKFMGMDGVRFLGAIPRRELVQEQMKAEIQAYPCTYPELFCYSVAECQIAGALPITSDVGALATTNMGVQVTGSPYDRLWQKAWVDMIVQHLKSDELKHIQEEVQQKALERFSLDKILGDWERVFDNNE